MIAVLWAPELPLSALVRASPELAHDPVAVGDGASLETAALVAVSARARASGVRPGMRSAQARGLCPELVLRPRDAALEESAMEALRDAALAFSPRVEVGGAGWAALDVSGLESLVGTSLDVARGLVVAARKLGLAVRVGVGRTKTLARLAALGGDGCEVVPADPAREQAFLGPLPLAVLEPSAELAAALARFGLRTVADLARLSADALATRLGPEAVALCHRARGDEEGGGLAPMSLPRTFVERTSLEWPLDNLEPLAFVLRGLVDRLVARLALYGFVAGDLRVTLGLESGGVCERRVAVAAPTRDVRVLVELCRLRLSEAPPESAVVSVAVGAAPERGRERQLSLFAPVGPSPEKLALTLARLAALVGPERVGAPRVLDSWVSDAFGMTSFGPGQSTVDRQSTIASRRRRGPGNKVDSTNDEAASANEDAPEPVAPLTLRRFRPPRPISVVCVRGAPAQVRGPGFGGRVVRASGPYRRREPWWERAQGGRELDLFDVTLSDGVAYRIAVDHGAGEWVAEGWYD
jgi:protein ImuB